MSSFQDDWQVTLEWERNTALLESTSATLEWDERTGMPDEAGAYRAEQITFLSGLIHQRRTDPQLGERLERLKEASQSAIGDGEQQATIKRWYKDYQRRCKLPISLVQAISKATVLGQQAWSTARPNNDYKSFRPHLEEILRLRREEASLLSNGGALYDALIDQYEEGASVTMLRQVFEELRQLLVPLVQQLVEDPNRPSGELTRRNFAIDRQREFSRQIAERVGFSFSSGRLDETSHPFCTTLGPHDCRILTRYFVDQFNSGLFGTLHEAGHGMYEQGLRADQFGLPMGTAVSLGIHESQSRLWENMVGRSRAFWEWCFPIAQKTFPESLGDATLDCFVRDINRVERSLIRVEADEVTYNLHILIRFELERELLDQELTPNDLPEAWNDRYQRYLGIKPPDDRDGVLQDIHWSAGLIGYFPTYTLGNLYAAQFLQAARRDLGDLEGQWRKGEFAPLLDWLREKIHRHGRRYEPIELLRNVTGESLQAMPLVAYLKDKLMP